MIERLPVMGYSVATEVGGAAWRYTEWVGYDFARFVANYSDVHGIELYNLTVDPDEGENVYATRKHDPAILSVQTALHDTLLAGWRGV